MDIPSVYFSKEGEGYKAVLASENTTVILSEGTPEITNFEMECLHELKKVGVIDKIDVLNFSDLNSININNLNVTYYAFDEFVFNNVLSLSKKINNIYLNGDCIYDIENILRKTSEIRNKTNINSLLYDANINISIPDGETLDDYEKLSKNIFSIANKISFPIIIKSSWGIGGKGNLVCYSKGDIILALKIIKSKLFNKKSEYGKYTLLHPFRVEEYFENKSLPNSFFMCQKTKQPIYISDQIINEVFYNGNEYPSKISLQDKYKIIEYSELIRNYLYNKLNYIGGAGVDFMIANNKIFINEINPRINSVSHAHIISNGKPFKLQLFKYEKKISTVNFFKDINPFLYKPGMEEGILPYQFSNSGKILFLIISNNYWFFEKINL